MVQFAPAGRNWNYITRLQKASLYTEDHFKVAIDCKESIIMPFSN